MSTPEEGHDDFREDYPKCFSIEVLQNNGPDDVEWVWDSDFDTWEEAGFRYDALVNRGYTVRLRQGSETLDYTEGRDEAAPWDASEENRHAEGLEDL
jgi:hypothetical protein